MIDLSQLFCIGSSILFYHFVLERPLMYKKGIIISTHNEFEIVNIASINNISTSSQSFKDSTANITSFAIDVVKAKIYYIDKKNDALKQMDLETLQINVLTKIQNGKGTDVQLTNCLSQLI